MQGQTEAFSSSRYCERVIESGTLLLLWQTMAGAERKWLGKEERSAIRARIREECSMPSDQDENRVIWQQNAGAMEEELPALAPATNQSMLYLWKRPLILMTSWSLIPIAICSSGTDLLF